jgi:NADP-dependent 3-hydroxy acid dehydrogenase YdfG
MTRNNWFITGVSSGIGRALAATLLERGARVAGTVRRKTDLAAFEALAPGKARGYLLDVADTAATFGIVGAVLDEFGAVDAAVNNAGQSLWGAVEETAIGEARAVFDTNVFGTMVVMQAFLPHFRARGQGLFINLSSGCGLYPVAGCGVYSASKFALEALSEAVANETAVFGVRVMLVEPGAVATRFISHNTAEASLKNDAYAGLTGGGKATMDPWYQDASSAQSVADAILAAAAGDNPPLRLAVGAGMRESAHARFSALAQSFA